MPDAAAGLHADADRLDALAAQAADRLGAEDHVLRVGPARVVVRVVGSSLAPRVLPALAHVTTPGGDGPDAPGADPVLTLWDMREAGQSLPALSLLPDPAGPPSSTYRVVDGPPAVEAWFQPLESAISLFDHARPAGWYCVRDADGLPPWESAAPLRALLRWALAARDLHLVHAAAVGRDGRGLLLAARGGSGKSTTTALAAAAGLATAGDDYVVLEPAPGGAASPRVHSLYRTVKLHADLLRDRFPHLTGVEAGHGKRALWVDELAPGRLVPTLDVAAVLVPHVSQAPVSRFERSSPAVAVRGLGPSTIFQLPGRPAAALRAMTALAARVPVFDVALGTDLDRIPADLAALLDAVGADARPVAEAG